MHILLPHHTLVQPDEHQLLDLERRGRCKRQQRPLAVHRFSLRLPQHQHRLRSR